MIIIYVRLQSPSNDVCIPRAFAMQRRKRQTIDRLKIPFDAIWHLPIKQVPKFHCANNADLFLLLRLCLRLFAQFYSFPLDGPTKTKPIFSLFFFFSLLYFKIEIVINSRGNSLALQIGFLGFLVVVAEQIGLAASIDVDIIPRYACIVVGGARERTIMITIIVITCVMCDPIWVPMRPLLLLHSPASRLGAILISFSRMNMNMSFGWILHIFFLFVIRKKIADSHFPR